ncbi:phosphatidylinositol 4,5-bisphosphate 3-kinase catalytic subunit delta isoform-like isoform X1 [Penaeus chinensis]|nr:phosphatidylinositol 4,5-bisphosphate 3-kinase catalytic subunit delta isoform-like isoform X1 [Penaeus chinensis]XP_047485038.1 phosphatidylinositol 4,5-bisphosphate 3-kinase catalytic subunit delta isoform-like isoform X1 [Penaeus chinensis]XP_047485039.1 phosphatidylinositol 4,5-bisphosphate 3-kinase catalytic subunit delta isoform-like isoform X1 [Penaeus chinensis]
MRKTSFHESSYRAEYWEKPTRRHTVSVPTITSGGTREMPTVPMGRPRPLPYSSQLMQGLGMELGGLRGPHSTPSTVQVDFLMPNSIIIQHHVSTSATLAEIKEELWERASEYPLFGTLHELSAYHFACVSQRSETLELMDETKCLQEINPFLCVLKVVERKGNETEKLLNLQIGQLIGKELQKFDALKNPEVNEFRWKMKAVCDEVVASRNKLTWTEQVQYQYPARIAANEQLPNYILDRLQDEQLLLSVQFDTAMQVQSTFTFRVRPDMKTVDFLDMALAKLSITFVIEEAAENYVLKTPGKEEYLIADVHLSQYMYIREYVCQDQFSPIPLVIVHRGTIQVDIDNICERIADGVKHMRNSFSGMTLSKKKNVTFISSWSITDRFSFQIGTITKLNLDSDDQKEVVVEAGLYHGSNALCETQTTQEVSVRDGEAVIEETLSFGIDVCNIPRSTRVCLAIYEVTRSAKATKARSSIGTRPELYKNPLAWVNTAVYDYRNQLKGGSMSLYAWKIYEDQSGDVGMPNPLGTLVSNPDHDQAVTLTVSFTKYHPTSAIIFPSRDKIISTAKENPPTDEMVPTVSKMDEVRQIAERDPLTELHEQERKLIWSLRNTCRQKIPHLLPKLLQCVEWDNNAEVAEMIALLEEWPKLSPDRALELLDYAYPEPAVRSYAIECLAPISDDDLLLYLLQLVQALKHENYLYCHLVEFLLNRALRNMRIGHFFFWHLRSEMHVPSVSIRFGLILEAYCRGSVEHMKILLRQLDALNKFKEVRGVVNDNRSVRDRAERMMKEYMNQPHARSALSHFLNPIDPMYRISNINSDECKFKDSKMAPLWLVFENGDSHGKKIYLLYKYGDDLRQDMLTLQMIKIMDKLWKDHGLDLRMNPYSCMSTDNREGIIQVVLNAETIANIQRKKGVFSATCAFRKGSLLAWLKDHNTTEAMLNKAIQEFTLSCAGYCVATYVLGVADRHSDNIMIMKNGQLFHIDFGHILGHFKEKFGIKRERQPFVLTHDFIHVITKGRTRSEEFIQFKSYCEQAFLILRRYGSFIISLFAMMISTGLPELQSEKDLDYLKETLKLDLTETDALEHFRSKFDEALSNSWKTSVNWAIHSMAKNNR